jgi:hypothetical protein
MLLHGATTDEVEATRAVDHLGDDPVASFVATAAELKEAFGEPGAMARTAYHRAGGRTGAQLLGMRVLDVAVHTWDLARPSAPASRSTPGSSPSLSPSKTPSTQDASAAPSRRRPARRLPAAQPRPVCST